MITEVKYKGITTSPSDYESPDGDLAIGSNIISDNGALVVPDPSPTPKIEFGSNKPIFIHTPLGGTMANYIVQNGQKIRYWTYKEGDTPSLTDSDNIYTMAEGEGLYQCTAVGNTLVVLTSAGINYFLFKDGAYKDLGKELPETLLQFRVVGAATAQTESNDNVLTMDDIVDVSTAAQYNQIGDTYSMAGKPIERKGYHWLYTRSGSQSNGYTLSSSPNEGDKLYNNLNNEIATVSSSVLRFGYSSVRGVPGSPSGGSIRIRIPYYGHIGEPVASDFNISIFPLNSTTAELELHTEANEIVIVAHTITGQNNATITVTMNNQGRSCSTTLYQECGSSVEVLLYTPTKALYYCDFPIVDGSGTVTGYEKIQIQRGNSDITLQAEDGYSPAGNVRLKLPSNTLVDKYCYKISMLSYNNSYEPIQVYISKNDALARFSSDPSNSNIWQNVNANIRTDPNYYMTFTAELDASTSGKYGYILIIRRPVAGFYNNRTYDIEESLQISVLKSQSTTVVEKAFAITQEGKANVDIYNKVLGLANDFDKRYGVGNDKFAYPFFVRYAYRLFDGSLTKPSAPVLMIPCSGQTPIIRLHTDVVERVNHNISMYPTDLHFKVIENPSGLNDYSDIITGVVISVSQQIYTYDKGHEFDENKVNISLSKFNNGNTGFGYHFIDRNGNDNKLSQMERVRPVNTDKYYLVNLPTYTEDEYRDKLLASSLTYVVKEYDIDKFIRDSWNTSGQGSPKDVTVTMESGILNNITTRELFTENVFSLSRLIPHSAFAYNNRLNVANYDQVVFNGYHAALMNGRYSQSGTLRYSMGSSVSGSIDANKFVVTRKWNANINNGGLMWFFYPNNNAKTAKINGTEITLKQHPLLNGSYWFNNFNELTLGSPSDSYGSLQANINVTSVMRNKYLYLTFGESTGTFRVVFTYKKVNKLDPSVDVNSVNVPTESFVHTFTRQSPSSNAGFWINSTIDSKEDVTTNITQTIISITIYANVTTAVYNSQVATSGTDITFNIGTILSYPNKIASSVVNNPFNFEASGVSQIQSERIVALSSATKALGQEQHGTHPLYVFTNDGVFGMQVDSEGKYTTKNPVCRDVVLGGGESITQIDDAVVFASARGIMSLAGEQAVCISEKLNELLIPPVAISIPPIITEGRIRSGSGQPLEPMIGCRKEPFKEYVNGAIIIFDYLNQRLIVSNKDYDYSYVYSIRTKQWSYYDAIYVSSLNSYPDGLAVDGANNVVDVADSTVNQYVAGTDKYSGWFLTRPISLGDSESYKIVDFIRQNGIYRQFSLYAWRNGSTTYYTPSETPNVGDFIYDSNGNRIWSGTIPNIHITEVGTTGSPAVPYIKVNIPRSSAFNRSASDIVANNTMSRITSVDAPSGGDDGSGKYSVQEYANAVGEGYISNAIQQVLYGSNDLINWHIISSSRSPRISDYSGSPYKWFRLAVRCTFLAGGSLSSVTFSWRKKFDNTKLL